MKLTDYIFGSRRGREANRLERDAMSDPFLAEALDGFDGVYGNHSDKLADLRQRIEHVSEHGKRTLPALHRRRIAVWSSVAAVTLGTVVWLFVIPAFKMQEQDVPVMVAANTPLRMQAAKAVVAESKMAVRTANSENAVTVELYDSAAVEKVQSDEIVTVAVPMSATGNNRFVRNLEFEEYFRQNRKVTMLADGAPAEGVVIVEFRVNDVGVPSAIQVVSGFSTEVNADLIRLLIEGPRWEPTGDRRIRIEVTYP